MKSLNDFPNKEEYHQYLRVQFAMAAMQGVCANDNFFSHEGKGMHVSTGSTQKYFMGVALSCADELLKQLDSNPL